MLICIGSWALYPLYLTYLALMFWILFQRPFQICYWNRIFRLRSVKLWFTNTFLLALILCQIWLYFVQLNLNKIQSNLSVRFNVRVECESLVKNCEDRKVRDWLVSGQPAKGHVKSTCWNLNSLLPGYILLVILCLGQVAIDSQNSLPGTC